MTAGRDEDQREPYERVHDVDRILAEMRAAVRETLAEHKRNGWPVVVWRDGRVVWLEPHEIPDTPIEE